MDDIRLLYVEDSRVAQKMLERVLGQIADFIPVSDLAEARQAIRSQRFTFFIVDYELPDGDGLQLVRELRAMPQYAETPVILYSPSLNNDLEYEAMRAGVNESLKKPMDMLELREHVVRLIDLPTIKEVRRELLQLTCFAWQANGKCYEYSPDLTLLIEGNAQDQIHDQMHTALRREALASHDPDHFPVEVQLFKHIVSLEAHEP